MTPDAVLPTRLDREIGAMKQVSSECVVPILAGPEARAIGPSLHVCYREPFYAEGTLKARIGSPLGTEFVARLAADLLRRVEALWSEGIVHRDIKPGNIALHGDRAILLDLGIAYLTDLTPVTDASSERTRAEARVRAHRPVRRSLQRGLTDCSLLRRLLDEHRRLELSYSSVCCPSSNPIDDGVCSRANQIAPDRGYRDALIAVGKCSLLDAG